MTSIRVFIGSRLDLPATMRLASVASAVRAAAEREGVRASWTRDENLHVTFKFLGAIESGRVPEIARAVAAVASRHPPIHGTLSGLGAFPSHGAPRVLFASLAAGAGSLAALANDIETVCAPLGFPRESRAFHPHVTLARVKSAPRGISVGRIAAALPSLDAGAYAIDAITVFQSELGSEGSRYLPLAASLLTPRAGSDGRK